MRFPFFRNRDSVKNGILISIRRTGDGFHPGLFMNSIKELKEQLGYEEIGLDDIFVFHCTQCGKCCIHREDILLSPKDLFHIAKKLKITPEVALAQYCETYLGRNSHIPVVRLKPQGSVKRCPLLKNQKCLVHDVKPAVCAMFPIGRYLALPSDGIFEYSCAVTPQVRQTGNRLSGLAGTAYASLLT